MKRTILLVTSVTLFTLLFMNSCKKKGSCEEFFEKDCATTSEYDPVCGCNGKTYANKSVAECAGVDYTQGSCD